MQGRVWKFGDNVNTDQIIPASYLNTTDPEILASHCLEGTDEDFPRKVKEGDIIVAGKNCGNTGYQGRVALYEMLSLSESIKELVIKEASPSVVKEEAKKMGMKTLRESGWEKVLQGLTTVEEVRSVTFGKEKEKKEKEKDQEQKDTVN